MQVEFVANASFQIRLASGKTLLTDPWYSDGIYYGSWYNFPPLTPERRHAALSLKPDYIYVSHIHPDHLDPRSLSAYPRETPILIGRLREPSLTHLRRSIMALGFRTVEVFDLWSEVEVDGAKIAILPQFASSNALVADQTGYEIDTSLYVRDADGTAVFNAVDNALHDEAAREVRDRLGRPDVAILPYAGGSFFPQGCTAYSDEQKRDWRDRIGQRRLDGFVRHAGILGARWTVPAAGSYVLGGRVAAMTEYLHQACPPAIEAAWAAAAYGPEMTLRQMASGDVIDTASGEVSEASDALHRGYTPESRLDYALSLNDRPTPHDAIVVSDAFAVPWGRLLERAAKNMAAAAAAMNLDIAYDVEIAVRKNSVASTPDGFVHRFALDHGVPHGERRFIRFGIDDGLMLMVLLGAANWNNVEIASLMTCERTPDTQDPSIHNLMNAFRL